MLELIALLVYLSRLVALARSRGRSPAWALGGLLTWGSCVAVGWIIAPHDAAIATCIGLPLAVASAMLYYRALYRLHHRECAPTATLGNNFACPRCACLQTEDRSGHLACHGCGHVRGAA